MAKNKSFSPNQAFVVMYNGNEMSQIGEKLIADYLFDNAKGTNIVICKLDSNDIADAIVKSAVKTVQESTLVTSEEEKTPLQHALTYVGETIDTTSGLSTFIIQLVTTLRNEENSADKKMHKAVSIIACYDHPTTRAQYPEYKKYGFEHAHIDAIKNLNSHLVR